MLSILIPTFNYDIVPLVKEIHNQCVENSIEFEILAYDDASEFYTSENKIISHLSNTTYEISQTNLGRIAARQQLANTAKYDWLLFLDADVLPKSEQFIQNYLNTLKTNVDAIYGGFAYHEEPPKSNHTLRWKYGKTKEQVSSLIRNKTPYKIVISANFLIKKTVFLSINSQIESKDYGYDNYFGALLKARNTKVFHIDNEVFHLGIEDNSTYLKKIKQAVETLHHLYITSKITSCENDLLELFKTFKKNKLHIVFGLFFKWFQTSFEKQLTGKNPSITLLQLYKLSYICYIDHHI
ncbi:Glycosyl transferase family 2 [Mariniflexile rhizosphaerae]|uniref:glycosyltransferase family 2 protein n=1 Tax=unclassified Mariniflexile TaxID=2643887 RepID=UPI000CC8230D|nr:glycosyltransferase [Mariniflexile sp. TRM1-10]AXP81730.1 Glycosyl transferase family 2 [Mariniflexile sp. TRM1-10]PLB20890.1 MAG: Glycosyl transferase family 2 [Flavobacteriaceae bacterium FS1-H7996/R]